MTGDVAGSEPGNRLNRLFDVSPEDGPLLEDVCNAFLKQRGVEAGRFFERLRRAGEASARRSGSRPRYSN